MWILNIISNILDIMIVILLLSIIKDLRKESR